MIYIGCSVIYNARWRVKHSERKLFQDASAYSAPITDSQRIGAYDRFSAVDGIKMG
jgi:hypothetical protein